MLPADLAGWRDEAWRRAQQRHRLLAEAEALEAASLAAAERADAHLIEQGDAKRLGAQPVVDVYGTRWWRSDLADEYLRLEDAARAKRLEAAKHAPR